MFLYGSKKLVVPREMLKALTSFDHQEAQQTTGMTEKRGSGRQWEYSVVEESMESMFLHSITAS